ncbi:MAG: SHOCT domain-containing protein [Desulfoprunum sp.]|jgi:putative membrane protein|uniref:SHOCT domain-containing protein n=1 Tax=Desulfoprunum sp. TaxID=2020866 RepID=UPI000ADFBA45
MRPEYYWHGGWWGLPMMMPVIMVIVVLIVLYLIFGRAGSRPPWGGDADKRYPHGREVESAIDILKKRYAGGEISKEEYEQIKKDLES